MLAMVTLEECVFAHDASQALFDEFGWTADEELLLSDEHFRVEGTLIEAAAVS